MQKSKLLFKKEWQLNLRTAAYLYIYCTLTLMLLIPNYPYVIAFFYCLLGIPNVFSLQKGNRDIEFNSMLPLTRADIVKSKTYIVIFIQLLQIVVALPIALISALILNPTGNLVGIDANFTLFAFALLEFSAFNIIFLPKFFATGYKVAIPALWAFVGYFLITLTLELPTALIPTLNLFFDGYIYIGAQIALLAISILLYIITIFVTIKLSTKKFEEVNL